MFDYYRAAGIPGGPFAQPTTVYTTESGTGKYHRNFACGSAAPTVPHQVVLWDLPADRMCQVCGPQQDGVATDPYFRLARQLIRIVGDAEKILAGERPQLGWRDTPLDMYLLWRHHASGRLVDPGTYPDLAGWAEENLTPKAAAVRDLLEQQLPGGPVPDRWARHTATEVVLGARLAPEAWEHLDLPALGVTPDRELRPAGQAHVVNVIRDALVEAYLTGADPHTAVQVAVAAGRVLIDEQTFPEDGTQIPDVATPPVGDLRAAVLAGWREAAYTEVAQVAAALGRKVDAVRAAVDTAPVHAVSWKVGWSASGGAKGIAGAVIDAYTVARWDDDVALTYLPEPIYSFVRKLPSNKIPCDSWGPVQPGDTVEVFASAAEIVAATRLDGTEAAQAARAVAVTVT